MPYSTFSHFIFTDLESASNKEYNTSRSLQWHVLRTVHAEYIACIARFLELRPVIKGSPLWFGLLLTWVCIYSGMRGSLGLARTFWLSSFWSFGMNLLPIGIW
jgi:hypothetical protein